MIKKLLVVIAILVSAISVKAQSSVGDWKLHPNFDYYFKDVIFMLCPEGEEKMGEVENILEIMSENPQIGKR